MLAFCSLLLSVHTAKSVYYLTCVHISSGTLNSNSQLKMFITSKIIHPEILVNGSNSLSGIPNRSTNAFLLKYAGSFPHYAGKFPYYAGNLGFLLHYALCFPAPSYYA